MASSDDRDRRYTDADWLRHEYHEQERSMRQIADRCGVDAETIRHWMEKHGIDRRSGGEGSAIEYTSTIPDPETVKGLYWDEEFTLAEIGDRFGVGGAAVSDYMSRHGIRQKGEHTNHLSGEDLLDDIIAGYVSLGVWPDGATYSGVGEYAVATVSRRFGSYEGAVEKAKERYQDTADDWPEPADLEVVSDE